MVEAVINEEKIVLGSDEVEFRQDPSIISSEIKSSSSVDTFGKGLNRLLAEGVNIDNFKLSSDGQGSLPI